MTVTLDLIPILIAPHPALRAKARPVVSNDDTIGNLSARMLAAMYAAPGIGLAAPQVGLGLRMFVMDLQANDRRQPFVLINPEIVAQSVETAVREEGCLSIPGQYADVVRPRQVRVRYLDLMGARQEIEGEGLLSACLQHEIDHLDGILFIDHLSSLKRNMLMRKLAKEQKAKKGA
jgi:peptide deformylase